MAAVLMGTATINAQTVTPPYLNEFASSIGDMKVINTDADSPSFIFSSYGGNSYGGGVTYTGNSTYKADDYLVSPALEVKEGNIYTISFMSMARGFLRDAFTAFFVISLKLMR